ncbi:hypothetical protein HPB51_014694 [Rhipicephalus microplus]|uniref:PNT domain-containing protein n=1 Tax=Rhipicephalus microplus TaxID=6941 RepID=A0A9J6DMI8_RHIMP|nr:hypothetical protein HPB51_014694 [Rhipicephalus microplus]
MGCFGTAVVVKEGNRKSTQLYSPVWALYSYGGVGMVPTTFASCMVNGAACGAVPRDSTWAFFAMNIGCMVPLRLGLFSRITYDPTLSNSTVEWKDPSQWNGSDIRVWLSWVTGKFGLPALDAAKFPDNGEALCALTTEQFLERTDARSAKILNDFLALRKKDAGLIKGPALDGPFSHDSGDGRPPEEEFTYAQKDTRPAQ